jgi:hypothetical protein
MEDAMELVTMRLRDAMDIVQGEEDARAAEGEEGEQLFYDPGSFVWPHMSF